MLRGEIIGVLAKIENCSKSLTTLETLIPPGSVTKAMTTVAVIQAIEAGKIAFDTL